MTSPALALDAAAFAERRRGLFLVAASAVIWSFGGALVRAMGVDDDWTIVFWRSLFAAAFIVCFMIATSGPSATLRAFTGIRWPAIAVGLCFASASICFVLALAHTTVANVVLINAGVPLIAALIGRVVFGTRVELPTWIAIGAVLFGVGVMVSDSLAPSASSSSMIGNLLAIAVAISFATATVITRQFSGVSMAPAVGFGTMVAALVASQMAGGYAVSTPDLLLLVMFGAFNLGLGMAFFVTGARLLPAALAALIGTAETVLGPIWVWIFHGEVPSTLTFIGGTIVFAALIGHILNEARQTRQSA